MGLFDIFDEGKRREKARMKDYAKAEKAAQKFRWSEEDKRECYAELDQCNKKMEFVIGQERYRYLEKKRAGKPYRKHEERLRAAAIARLITDQALEELEDLSADSNINHILNNLGHALGRLNRIDAKEPVFKGKKFVKILGKSNENMDAHVSGFEATDIPQEYISKVDDQFIQKLIAGAEWQDVVDEPFVPEDDFGFRFTPDSSFDDEGGLSLNETRDLLDDL